jgi:hypothetical protein
LNLALQRHIFYLPFSAHVLVLSTRVTHMSLCSMFVHSYCIYLYRMFAALTYSVLYRMFAALTYSVLYRMFAALTYSVLYRMFAALTYSVLYRTCTRHSSLHSSCLVHYSCICLVLDWWNTSVHTQSRVYDVWDLKVLVWCKKYPAVAGYFIMWGRFCLKLKWEKDLLLIKMDLFWEKENVLGLVNCGWSLNWQGIAMENGCPQNRFILKNSKRTPYF